jgi:uncharacterized protein
LAKELGADLAIVDELAVRQELSQHRIPVIGTVGVLMAAKSRGQIGSLKFELDRL